MKDKDDLPGGKILSTYCTCITGLKGTCNHVAGLLFRVDSAVMKGLTKPSKTSTLSTWNVPSGSKVDVEPTEASKMVFQKCHYTSASNRDFVKEKDAYLKFNPTLHSQEVKMLEDIQGGRKRFYDEIKDIVPTSRFSELMEERPLSRPNGVAYDLPEALTTQISNFVYLQDKSIEENVELFTQSLNVTDKQIDDVKHLTQAQNINTHWGFYRKGRLTASNFSRINSRSKTLQVKPDEDPMPLINTLTGRAKTNPSYAMKQGNSLEPSAFRKYRSIMTKGRQHTKFKVEKVGLVILKSDPFIAVSPDGEIFCECCQNGVLEIKCPARSMQSIPLHTTLSYLLKETDPLTGHESSKLTTNHEYYFQVQGQMAVTKSSYCDFFVYSKNGYHLEIIKFDSKFWESMLFNFQWFWRNRLAPYLITQYAIDLSHDAAPIDESVPENVDADDDIFFEMEIDNACSSQSLGLNAPKSVDRVDETSPNTPNENVDESSLNIRNIVKDIDETTYAT